MKMTFIRSVLVFALLMAFFGLAGRAFGEDADLLKQAQDLVHQAWNPAGDPPSNDQRTELLTKAIELARNAPQHHVHHHRVDAINLIKAALEEIKNGDPDKKVNGYLHDADAELREAISESV